MSTKSDKFKSLMRSPSAGSSDDKEAIVDNLKSPMHEIVPVRAKKKATFELDADLHRWLKMRAVFLNRDMVVIVEELIERYRQEVEGK